MSFHVPERYRVSRDGGETGDPFGAFLIPRRPGESPLRVIACASWDEVPFDHVSVSLPDRCPTWDEMCRVKDLFWTDDECVMQLHPPRSEHVNTHPYCLHMWRPTQAPIPRPPTIAV